MKKLVKKKLLKFKKFIPVNTTLINNNDASNVAKSIQTNWGLI